MVGNFFLTSGEIGVLRAAQKEARSRMTKSHSVGVPTQTVVTFLAKKSYSENDKSSPRTRCC